MEPNIQPSTEFNNDEPDHRTGLIRALRREGLEAYEYHSGGGLMHVVVNLLDRSMDGSADLLQIATGSVASSCDVALMGWNADGNVQSVELVRTPTLQDAVGAFKTFWAERATWTALFDSGELDL